MSSCKKIFGKGAAFLGLSICVSATLLCGAARRIAPAPSLLGVIVNEPDSVAAEKRAPGLYRLQLHNPEGGWSPVLTDSRFTGADGVVNCGDRTLSVSRSSFAGNDILDLNIFDNLSWKHLKRMAGDAESSMIASAYASDDDLIYAYFRRLDGSVAFGCLNPDNGERKFLRTGIVDTPVAMTASSDGQIYAFTADGRLCTVSSSDGALTPLYDSLPRSSASRVSSAFVDDASGAIYWSCSTDSVSSLYTVDVNDGSCALVGNYPGCEQIAGLMLARLATPLKAPDAPTAVSLSIEGSSLSGILTFSAPATLYDGTTPEVNPDNDSAASDSDLTWIVAVDGDVVSEGTASFGADVKTEISFAEPGMHTVSVWFENEEGASPEGVLTRWVGADVPAAVNALTLSYDADKARYHLRWEAPEGGAHGGQTDMSTLCYDVVRLPSGITVAENISVTEFSETVEDPSAFTTRGYAVTAKNSSGVGVTSSTPCVPTSTIPLPVEIRPGEWLERGLVIVDNVNGDDQTWESDKTGEIGVGYSATEMDDWFFLPAVSFEQGKIYPLSFECHGGSRSYTERIEVKMGRSPEPAAMTTTVVRRRTVVGRNNVNVNTTVRPQESGEWYIGFHGCSEPSSLRLSVGNIMLGDSLVVGAPQPVTDLKVVNDPTGAPEFDFEFVAPTHTVDGRELSLISEISVRDDIELLTVFRDVRPGQICRAHINRFIPGGCTLRIIPNVNGTAGQIVTRKFSVGASVPGSVGDVSATLEEAENPADDVVVLSWTAPEVDINGYDIVPALIGYDVYDSFGQLVVSVDNVTTVRTAASATGGACAYKVVPRSSVLEREKGVNIAGAACTEAVRFRAPLPVDYKETLQQGRTLYPWGVTSKGATGWIIADCTSLSPDDEVVPEEPDAEEATDEKEVDNDAIAKKCFRLQGSAGLVESTLHTGFVSFESQQGVVSFDYRLSADQDAVDALAVIETVMVLRDSTEISLGSIQLEPISVGDAEQCKQLVFPIEFGEEVTQPAAFRIRATLYGESVMEIDNVLFESQHIPCVKPAPMNLTAVGVDEVFGVLLSWDSPEDAPEVFAIYRDGVYLGSVTGTQTSYFDFFEGENADYRVVGEWITDRGERIEGEGAEVHYQRSGSIDISEKMSSAKAIKIEHRGGELNLSDFGFDREVAVFTLDGRLLYRGTPGRLSLPKAIICIKSEKLF